MPPSDEGDRPVARLVIVTGLSGAGRSTALKALEDLGYETADNLPLSLGPALLGAHPAGVPLALGIPIRGRDFAADAMLAALGRFDAEIDKAVALVFLDCADDRLIHRYTETRHRHPMAGDRPVSDGIALERRLVSPLRARADLVIDTTALSPGDLKRLLHGHFAIDAVPGIAIFVASFSYRHGLPRDADLVLDVRFLRNPHYVAALEPLTGRDPDVAAYIEADPDYAAFFEGLVGWLGGLLPRYEGEGKSYLTIAVGCTGGRHRSVHVAARLGARLAALGFRVEVDHRDLDRGADFSGTGK
ncbi:MAG: RNase adapter RapZ [Stellaceae bacterium]